jgi:hypothetical protein
MVVFCTRTHRDDHQVLMSYPMRKSDKGGAVWGYIIISLGGNIFGYMLVSLMFVVCKLAISATPPRF